jgi:hypothetical protein
VTTDNGYEPEEPGGFVQTLLQAITKADEENLERLRRVYPTYVDELVAATRGGVVA